MTKLKMAEAPHSWSHSTVDSFLTARTALQNMVEKQRGLAKTLQARVPRHQIRILELNRFFKMNQDLFWQPFGQIGLAANVEFIEAAKRV